MYAVGYFEQELTLHADQEDNVVFKLVKDQSKIPANVTAGHDNLGSMVHPHTTTPCRLI